MSRSRRKNSITGNTTSDSEKYDKRLNNRKMRRQNKLRLINGRDFVEMKQVSNPYNMDKDGRQMFDPKKHPNLMRK
jgi:hypothetical protein